MASQETVATPKPQWLTEAVAATKIKKSSKPVQNIVVDALPPVCFAGWRADRECVDLILAGLQRSTPEDVHPFILELRKHRADRNCDAFVWAVLEQWIDSGASPKRKWAILGVTMLGSEMLVFRLIPFLRKWRAASFYDRAKFALECLCASDELVALSEISEISYLVQLGSLHKRAREIMERLARQRGLTTDELEDRIVPDCGLTDEGTRVFDYGTRTFRFRLLIHDLKPAVMDAEGNKYEMLPAPEPRDDAHLADIAMADWHLVSEIVQSIVDAQTIRLEQAMINDRRWKRSDFDEFLLKHPIMQHLIKLIVWASYDADGKMIGTFRVADDNTFADERDAATTLPGCTAVGIVHPCMLQAETRGHWGEVFSDYEIVTLFSQLGRPVFALEYDESMKKTIERAFPHKTAGSAFGRALERMSWVQGTGSDVAEGAYTRHFHAYDLTAVINVSPGIQGRGVGQEVVCILYFLKGIRSTDLHLESQRIALCFIAPQLISEALRDLTAASVGGCI